jgi:hypothetical protein
MDAYAKTILTVIAACLLLQVAQGFGLVGAAGQVSSSSSDSAGRYMLQANPMARLIFRFDRATGRTWTIPLQFQKQKVWTLIGEAPAGEVAPEEGDGAPSSREESEE